MRQKAATRFHDKKRFPITYMLRKKKSMRRNVAEHFGNKKYEEKKLRRKERAKDRWRPGKRHYLSAETADFFRSCNCQIYYTNRVAADYFTANTRMLISPSGKGWWNPAGSTLFIEVYKTMWDRCGTDPDHRVCGWAENDFSHAVRCYTRFCCDQSFCARR